MSVLRVSNRPTASCIAYGLHHEDTPTLGDGNDSFEGRLVLVADVLGHGEAGVEVEVTLLEIDQGVYEIHGFATGRGQGSLRATVEHVLGKANADPVRVTNLL